MPTGKTGKVKFQTCGNEVFISGYKSITRCDLLPVTQIIAYGKYVVKHAFV
jgi:hypothetical protein